MADTDPPSPPPQPFLRPKQPRKPWRRRRSQRRRRRDSWRTRSRRRAHRLPRQRPDLVSGMATLADNMLARVHYYGLGSWLDVLFAALGLPPPLTPLTTPPCHWIGHHPDRRVGAAIRPARRVGARPRRGRRHGPDVARPRAGDRDAGERRGEAVDQHGRRLSRSGRGGRHAHLVLPRRRPDRGAPFNPDLIGFDRIVLARLGAPLDWRDPASR